MHKSSRDYYSVKFDSLMHTRTNTRSHTHTHIPMHPRVHEFILREVHVVEVRINLYAMLRVSTKRENNSQKCQHGANLLIFPVIHLIVEILTVCEYMHLYSYRLCIPGSYILFFYLFIFFLLQNVYTRIWF